jgi:hypothetical protein
MQYTWLKSLAKDKQSGLLGPFIRNKKIKCREYVVGEARSSMYNAEYDV